MTPPSGGHRQDAAGDIHTIKTRLRPDYFEWFPRFSAEELLVRTRKLPFSQATLLDPFNISRLLKTDVTWKDTYEEYRRKDANVLSLSLANVLRAVGFDDQVSVAATAYRHHYAPTSCLADCYLNTSVGIKGDTNLSSPGLVAMMLNACRACSRRLDIRRVVDIGIGSGFHASAFVRLFPNTILDGFDLEPEMIERAKLTAHRMGLSDRVRTHPIEQLPIYLRDADLVYLTAGISLGDLAILRSFTTGDTAWCVPRQIERREWEVEPSSSWLIKRFATYDSYQRDNWTEYLTIDAHITGSHGVIPISCIYDTRFVRYHPLSLRDV